MLLPRHVLQEKREAILCYLDLDGLKYVNDKFGHLEGDMYIQNFVELIKNNFRRLLRTAPADELRVEGKLAFAGAAVVFSCFCMLILCNRLRCVKIITLKLEREW